jgi:hypothetical protein
MSNQSIRQFFDHLLLTEQVVFDDTPNFEEICEKFSKQTMASDEQLRTLIIGVIDSKKKALTKAIEVLEDKIDKKKISIIDIVPDTDTDPNHPIVLFSILIRDNGETITGFQMEIGENRIPTLNLDSRAIKNKAEKLKSAYATGIINKLRTIDADEFFQIDDVQRSTKRRNTYLNGIYKKVGKAVSDMSFVEVAMIKQILKTDFKGIK